MNILGLFLNNELRTGGHKRYLELMEGLAARGNGVTVLMNSYLPWKPSTFTDVRLEVPYVHRKTKLLGSLYKKKIAQALEGGLALSADWIVIFGETHWIAARFLSGRLARAAGGKVPVLFAFRSDTIEENRTYIRLRTVPFGQRCVMRLAIARDRLRERAIARGARLLAFQTGADRDRFVGRNPCAREKTAVIRGDIRQPRFRGECANANRSTSCRNLLFVGAMGKRKGLADLLRALVLAHRAGVRDIHLDILAGTSGYEPFARILSQAGLSELAEFRGKSDDPLSWMVRSDLVVVPSLFDSYPNVVLESLHSGVPVIGSRAGGIPDMLRDDRLLFAPGDPEDLARKITVLALDDGAYREARALCAQRRGYFDFDWAAEWERRMKETASC